MSGIVASESVRRRVAGEATSKQARAFIGKAMILDYMYAGSSTIGGRQTCINFAVIRRLKSSSVVYVSSSRVAERMS